MKITAKMANRKMIELDKSYQASAFDSNQIVVVRDEEGSMLIQRAALVLKYGDWLMVLAEHAKPRLYHQDEAGQGDSVKVFRVRRKIPEIGDRTTKYTLAAALRKGKELDAALMEKSGTDIVHTAVFYEENNGGCTLLRQATAKSFGDWYIAVSRDNTPAAIYKDNICKFEEWRMVNEPFAEVEYVPKKKQKTIKK